MRCYMGLWGRSSECVPAASGHMLVESYRASGAEAAGRLYRPNAPGYTVTRLAEKNVIFFP